LGNENILRRYKPAGRRPAIVLFASGKTGLAIVLLTALAVLIAAIVTWSERSSET
jgi:hypothetical protein